MLHPEFSSQMREELPKGESCEAFAEQKTKPLARRLSAWVVAGLLLGDLINWTSCKSSL